MSIRKKTRKIRGGTNAPEVYNKLILVAYEITKLVINEEYQTPYILREINSVFGGVILPKELHSEYLEPEEIFNQLEKLVNLIDMNDSDYYRNKYLIHESLFIINKYHDKMRSNNKLEPVWSIYSTYIRKKKSELNSKLNSKLNTKMNINQILLEISNEILDMVLKDDQNKKKQDYIETLIPKLKENKQKSGLGT